ncbi:MAG: FAD binding domain-containing protein [Acidobacteria bacterium]|nr:FAD binding domain-containing protein [Acidobacteriota bacterium]
MSLPEFKLLRPSSIEQASELLARYSSEGTFAFPPSARGSPPGGIRIIAGGTDLIPSMRQKLFEPQYVLDLRRIDELKGINPQPDNGVIIGALTTLTMIEHSSFLKGHYQVLSEAAAAVASPVIRNMGTIGGNICLDTRCLWYNQSLTWRKACGFCIKKEGDLCHVAPGGTKCWAAFSADTPPALLCLNAEIEIVGPKGARRIPLRDFYTGLGDAYCKLEANEILTRILIPSASAGYRGVYRKLRIRGSIDYPLAAVAVALKRANGQIMAGQVALTAVNSAPLLVKGAAQMLQGQQVDQALAEAVADLAAKTAKPLTTSALTPEYRREMIRVFTRRALIEAASN